MMSLALLFLYFEEYQRELEDTLEATRVGIILALDSQDDCAQGKDKIEKLLSEDKVVIEDIEIKIEESTKLKEESERKMALLRLKITISELK